MSSKHWTITYVSSCQTGNFVNCQTEYFIHGGTPVTSHSGMGTKFDKRYFIWEKFWPESSNFASHPQRMSLISWEALNNLHKTLALFTFTLSATSHFVHFNHPQFAL